MRRQTAKPPKKLAAISGKGKTASQTEAQADERGRKLAGKARCDRAGTEAQIRSDSPVGYPQSAAAAEVRPRWTEGLMATAPPGALGTKGPP